MSLKSAAFIVAIGLHLVATDAHAMGMGRIGRIFRKKPAPSAPTAPTTVVDCTSVGENVFSACYFNNQNLTNLRTRRDIPYVDFDWGTNSPDPAIDAGTFSARFSGRFNFEAGTYHFETVTDDGVRLWIDDQLVVDQWNDHGPTNFSVNREMTPGRHKVVMEYYQNQGAALARLSWDPLTDETPTLPGPGPGTGSGCSVAADMINFSQAEIHDSPADTPSWCVSTKITELRIGSDGVHLEFSKRDGAERWPDFYVPGWEGGNIQYTLWLMLKINGKWHASGIIEYWYGLNASGGDLTSNDQVARNWVYDGRWGAMQGHQPAPGEQVGFMVSAGDQRGSKGQLVKERSQVVILNFPSTSGTTFRY